MLDLLGIILDSLIAMATGWRSLLCFAVGIGLAITFVVLAHGSFAIYACVVSLLIALISGFAWEYSANNHPS